MLRTFRSKLIATIVAAATVPVVLVSIPLMQQISRATEEDAQRDLSAIATKLADTLEQDLTLLQTRIGLLANDSDLKRAVKSVLFTSKADTLLNQIVHDSPLIDAVYLLDTKRTLQAYAPPKAALFEGESVQAELRSLDERITSSSHGQRYLRGEERPFLRNRLIIVTPVSGIYSDVAGWLIATVSEEALRDRIAQSVQLPTRATLEASPSQQAESDTARVHAPVAFHSSQGKDLQYTVTVTEPKSVRFALVRETRYRLFAALAGTIAALAVLGYWFARRVARLEQEYLHGEVERATMETELRALRAQMQPHFLFNVLNNIATMIPTAPTEASEMISKLSELYRLILDSSKSATAPLTAEVRIVRNYLDLQKMRFGDRFRYQVSIADSIGECHIPCLVLQTLAENAVKHGISRSRDGGEIDIRVRPFEGGGYLCEIENTGATFHPDPSQSGTGLMNTRKRLEMLYGVSHDFQIGTEPNGRTVARFRFTGEKI